MTHRIATVKIEGVSPISFNRYHATEHLEKESHDDYAKRTWKEYCHYDKNGDIFIPPMMMKNVICESAKFLGIKVKGKGQNLYTKHFIAGTLVTEPAPLGINMRDLTIEKHRDAVFVPSSGVRGSGNRVMKYFPVFDEFAFQIKYHILDDTITKDVFEYVLTQAGQFIGIGRFRPINWGFYGRFTVKGIKWSQG